MIRYRYNVRFTLNGRPRADGTHTIRMAVTWKCRRVEYYLPTPCYPDQWDAVAQVARPSRQHKDVAGVNGDIFDYRNRVVTFFEQSAIGDHIPTVSEVQAALTAVEGVIATSHPLSDVLGEFVRTQKKERGWAAITARKFAILERELKAAGLTTIEEMNSEGVQRYYDWVASKDYENAVAMKKASILRWFLRWCRGAGYIDNDDYTLHQPRLKCPQKEVIYLTWEELMQLYYFDYGEHTALANARDVFCFCAFTGLRFSDGARLKWSDVHGDHITVVTQKTSDPLTIELNKYSRGIIERCAYRNSLIPSPRVLPAISIQKTNEHLKDCAMLAQIDEPLRLVSFRGAARDETEVLKWEVITTHCARRTFVVNALRLGIPAEVIMKWTGHKDFKAMRPYVAIVDELKRENMALFDKV